MILVDTKSIKGNKLFIASATIEISRIYLSRDISLPFLDGIKHAVFTGPCRSDKISRKDPFSCNNKFKLHHENKMLSLLMVDYSTSGQMLCVNNAQNLIKKGSFTKKQCRIADIWACDT